MTDSQSGPGSVHFSLKYDAHQKIWFFSTDRFSALNSSRLISLRSRTRTEDLQLQRKPIRSSNLVELDNKRGLQDKPGCAQFTSFCEES
ncbi:unnamed protein product [Protopolystoma xenopodis]|uniref:Uncharacterized protein n=1 Tax=Protopolystoma xenopodis TaxID=117903 RepID=A0A448XD94_9PLAT|nr:unnamed protein product [Protopolystoma xenopodis]